MTVPGPPSVMSFYLLHGEKGVVCSICLYLALPVMSPCPSTSCMVIRGVFMICLYLAFPVSCLSTDRKVRKGGGFNICPYLVFPVSRLPNYRKVNKGADLTYVHTSYLLCHVFLRPTCRKLKKGVGFTICMPVPSFPSTHRTYRNANKGAVLRHVLLFIARRTRGWFLHVCTWHAVLPLIAR